MRKEKVWERNLCRDVLAHFGVPNMKMQHPGGETGWPDREFFIPGGKPYLVECKEWGYKPEPRQDYIHGILRDLGYEVDWFDNYEDAYQAIREKVDAASRAKAGSKVPRGTRRGGAVVRPRSR